MIMASNKEEILYPGLEALPVISEGIYSSLSAKKRMSFPHQISPAVFDYYIAVSAYCRILMLHQYNRGDISDEEQNIIKTYSHCSVPPPIGKYLSGFGNVNTETGLSAVFQMLPRYKFLTFNSPQRSDAYSYPNLKRLACIDTDNHYLYSMYPCLEIYQHRISADLKYTLQGPSKTGNDISSLQFPVYTHTPYAGMPALNMLGYKPPSHLRSDQINLLRDSGIPLPKDQSFYCHYMSSPTKYSKLINNVQALLHNCINLDSLPVSLSGRNTQFCYQQAVPCKDVVESRYLNYKLTNACSFQIPASSSFNGGAFVYRLKRNVSLTPLALNPWCIFEFDGFKKVPVEWINTVNTAREKEDRIFHTARYKSVPYLAKERILRIITSL